MNGGFLNRKLDKRKRYRIIVRAVVDTPEKVKFFFFSSFMLCFM